MFMPSQQLMLNFGARLRLWEERGGNAVNVVIEKFSVENLSEFFTKNVFSDMKPRVVLLER